MFFEELCAHTPGKFRTAENSIKKKISRLLKEPVGDVLLSEFVEPFSIILTTNYDYALEQSIAGPLHSSACIMSESRYSLFRRTFVAAKEVWHIHGDINLPSTILLGYDHYAGYLQKIRNYLTTGLTPAQSAAIYSYSNSIRNIQDPSSLPITYSWVNHFLQNHLHIVGLKLDFTEIDLWWLLLYKRRRDKQTGHTFFYHVHIIGSAEEEHAPQLSLLKSLGVRVISISASSYREGYESILKEMKANIVMYPTLMNYLHPSQLCREQTLKTEPDNNLIKARRKNSQLTLKFPSQKRIP